MSLHRKIGGIFFWGGPNSVCLSTLSVNGVFYAPFNSISVISPNSSYYSCISYVSPLLGWGSEVSCPKTLPLKTHMIQYCLYSAPLDYELNTSPFSHAGPLQYICLHKLNIKTYNSSYS